MHIENFFDERTSTFSYLVYDKASKEGVVIDPVLDFDLISLRVFTESIDKIVNYIA